MARNGGTFLTREHDEQRNRQQVEHRDVEGAREGVARHVRADLGVGVRGQAEHEEDQQADPERGPGGPEHVADVLRRL